ncbi:MAG TPA: hypothetical protein VKY85_07630 [Candidatus Angelobacter sp.]|nr:hypothetical protein [Candidatus Angelobacter sp.]
MAEITVASTTDSQKAVEQAAAGLRAGDSDAAAEQGQEQESREQTSSGVSAQETESAAEAEAAGDEEESGEEREEQPRAAGDQEGDGRPRKSGVQKRIDTLTRRIHEQQEEMDALRAQVEKTGKGAGDGTGEGTQPRTAAATPDPEPQLADAKYRGSATAYEDWIRDHNLWAARKVFHDETAKQSKTQEDQAAQQRTAEVRRVYDTAAKAAEEKYPDFRDVVGSSATIPMIAQVAIIEAGDIGPEIAYYLGKHPEVIQELAELVEVSPMRVVTRIGQIEAALQLEKPSAGDTANGKSATRTSTGSQTRTAAGNGSQTRTTTPPPKKPTQTSAPAPITPVGGSSTKTTVPMDELPYRDYKRLRDQEDRARRG